MNSEEKKYLRSIKKMAPTYEIFTTLAAMLRRLQSKVDQLLKNSRALKYHDA
ncbi:MAG: hypothetical protein HY424_01975 [Candidatus Levybacteria bacterium]|nr:hypothetical protein [Candidatus Levybacteria bacterium]